MIFFVPDEHRLVVVPAWIDAPVLSRDERTTRYCDHGFVTNVNQQCQRFVVALSAPLANARLTLARSRARLS